jgi:DNA-directed RNA polymerase II subunit RPB1
MQGLSPTEMWFHAASGRRGVTDTHNKVPETGYISKKMNKKMEDYVQHHNGAVYDTNGNIITFLYGNDGMNAKFLSTVSIGSESFPFFVNPSHISSHVNSQYELANPTTFLTTPKREMTCSEICELANTLEVGSYRTPVTDVASSTMRTILFILVSKEKIYEPVINEFCYIIQDTWEMSKSPHGESVGLIAGFSLGQPTTQLTLNTFQSAGVSAKDVTLGLPWLRELINATENQSRRVMTIHLQDERLKHLSLCKKEIEASSTPNEVAKFKDEMTLLSHHISEEFLSVSVKDVLKSHTLRYLDVPTFNSDRCIVSYTEYEEKWWVKFSEDMKKIDSDFPRESWVVELEFDVDKLFSKDITLQYIADAIQRDTVDKNGDNVLLCVVSPLCLGRIDVFTDYTKIKSLIGNKLPVAKGSHPHSTGLLDEMTLEYIFTRDHLVNMITSTFIHGVSRIEKVDVSNTEGTDEFIVSTLGVNLKEILARDNICFEKTICNDMYEINNVLGIEAARNFLKSAITRVLCSDGTYINPRHISLLVDAMTRRGTITSVTRDGIKSDASVLGRGMFEQPVANFVSSSVFGEKDPMNSMSAAVMMGTLANTGMFKTIILDEDKMPAK